jgi:hypothetical protein
MKRFIAKQICFPLAIMGIAFSSAALITITPAIVAQLAIKIARIDTPEKELLDVVVDYDTALFGTGIIGIGVGLFGGAVCGGFGDDEDVRVGRIVEVEEEVFNQCCKCKYYSFSSLLPCAVHPIPEIECTDKEQNY